MTDKELLELAAKAAGIHLLWHERWGCWYDHNKRNESKDFQEWNPLTDDGDALRLAVKLNLEVDCCEDCVTVATEDAIYFDEQHNGDPYAATRRAIVRAAAEIGKEMR